MSFCIIHSLRVVTLCVLVGQHKRGMPCDLVFVQRGFHQRFLLDRREAESETVTSFYLVPEDGGTLPTYRPGQSLGFVLDLPDRMAPVIRNYTISDSPKDAFHYRLSIKR